MSKQPAKRASNSPADPTDLPLVEKAGAAIKALLEKGRETGYVTINDLNKALPTEENSSEQIEDIQTMFSELGIQLVDEEDTEDSSQDNTSQKEAAPAETSPPSTSQIGFHSSMPSCQAQSVGTSLPAAKFSMALARWMGPICWPLREM